MYNHPVLSQRIRTAAFFVFAFISIVLVIGAFNKTRTEGFGASKFCPNINFVLGFCVSPLLFLSGSPFALNVGSSVQREKAKGKTQTM
jgi:magnesium-transporting ATPase (P-type)